MIYILILLNILMLVTGQILWKVAVANVDTWTLQKAISVLLSPFFIGGGVLYVLATGLWLVILSKLPLSIAYPFQSISYVLGAIAAFLIFKETVTAQQWFGIFVIIIGVYFIAR
ncbi:EamA family transporter [Priestia endophytica]|uniref:EamA family transporter n=1 Tax=Priestia endophytica TaxID=135735 RepID=UPI000F5426D0|nr:EamA family transporter [Priestia endophytica]MED4071379.1 EamA family transporter [Priestia endophytica]